ncbi:hypothetical protein HDZ31DRAFT_40162 [Schizophyllum fasciatum]
MTANAHLDPFVPNPAQAYSHSPDASRPVASSHGFTDALPPLGTENFPDKARYLNHRHDQQRARDQRAGTQAEDYALPPSVVSQQPPYAHVIQPPNTARDGAYSAFSAAYPVTHSPSMPGSRTADERGFIDHEAGESPGARDTRFLAPVPPVPPPEPRVAQLDSPPLRSPAGGQRTIPIESAPIDIARDVPPSRANPPSARSPVTRRASTNIVIACKQCRARKIKCDSTRPSCHNCEKRQNPCEYDPAPKRRGPDKRPGTRQRACGKRPREDDGERDAKRRRFDHPLTIIAEPGSAPLTDQGGASTAADYTHSPTEYKPSTTTEYTPAPTEYASAPPEFAPSSPYHSRLAVVTGGLARDQNARAEPTFSRRVGVGSDLPANSRGLDRATSGLSVLTGATNSLESRTHPIDSSRRRRAGIMAQAGSEWWARFLGTELSFRDDTPHWLAFVHIDTLLDDLHNDETRPNIQPAFVLATLALTTLMKSSEAEWGEAGRERALYYHVSAFAHLTSAVHIDLRLAEAAIIMCVFAMSINPQYTPADFPHALRQADRLIARLGLCARDAADVDVVRFAPRQVPSVPGGRVTARGQGCRCADAGVAIGWPAYDRSEGAKRIVMEEESRRLCWAAVSLAAECAAECVAFGWQVPRYFVGEAANLTLLFPSETTDRANPVFRSADAPTQKETIRALYCRAMVLWQFTARLGEAGGMLSEKVSAQNGVWAGQDSANPPSAVPFSPVTAPFSPSSASGSGDGGIWGADHRAAWSRSLRENFGTRETQTTIQPDSPWTPDEQVEAAQEAFGEAQAIEDALELHSCVNGPSRHAGEMDKVLVYLTREHVFNVRTTVALVLRRLQGLAPPSLAPFPSRRQAEEWVAYQHDAIDRLGTTSQRPSAALDQTRATLARRPFAAPWLANQLALALTLVRQDRTMTSALALAKDLLLAVEIARGLWPVPGELSFTSVICLVYRTLWRTG